MNPKLQVILNQNRSKTGVAMLTMPDGASHHFACLAKSDNAAAAAAGNPTRNPLLPFGDIPTGTYTGEVTVAANQSVKTDVRSYGAHARILLLAVAGAALEACTGKKPRWGLMIHGGALGTKGVLRPTHGCIRLSEENMKTLLDLIGDSTLDVVVTEI